MGKITNFQTSFCITSSDTNKTFNEIKGIAFQWIKGKEKDQRIVENQRNFGFRLRPLKNLYNSAASIETDTFKAEEEERWAMRYCHPDREAQRYWYVDIGITKTSTCIVFSITVAYAWRDTYLGDQSEAPPPNIPWVVKGILQQAGEESWHCFSGSPTVNVSAKKIDVSRPGEGKGVWDLIENPDRRIPAIIFNGSSLASTAEEFSERLQGKAIVVLIHDDHELADELKHYIPRDMSVRHGQVRVFFAVNKQRRRPQVHRFFNVSDESFSRDRDVIIETILRNYALQEPNSTADVIEIGAKIKREVLIKNLVKETGEKGVGEAEVSKMLDEIAQDYQKKIQEKVNDLAMFEEENRNLEQELYASKAKIAYLQQANSVSLPEGSPAIVRGKEKDLWPGEIQGIARSCIEKSQMNFPEKGRIHDVIADLLQANKADNTSMKAIVEALNDVFRNGYDSLSKKDRQRLQSCGFTITEEGKHYKMHLESDDRHSVTFAKTASDHRAGMNIIRDIKAAFGIAHTE